MRLGAADALRATRTPAGPATLRLATRNGHVEAEAWGRGAEWVLERAPALVGDLDTPEHFRPQDPRVAALHRRLGGLRLGRCDAITEVLVPTIIEQKVAGAEARRSYARLVRAYGEPAPGPGGLLLPPSPARLAALPYFEFHPFGIEMRRAETIRRACARASRLEELVSFDPVSAHTRLTAIPGIGPWSAAHVTLLALGDPDAVMLGDFHIPHLISWFLAGERRSDDDRMLELLAPYAGQRARVIRLITAGGRRPPRRAPRWRLRAIQRI